LGEFGVEAAIFKFKEEIQIIIHQRDEDTRKMTKLKPPVTSPSKSYNKILRGYERLWIHL
jgi:hypothetical protein